MNRVSSISSLSLLIDGLLEKWLWLLPFHFRSPSIPGGGGVLPYKGLMRTCGQPGYVFRDFCLKEGIDFVSFCHKQGIFS